MRNRTASSEAGGISSAAAAASRVRVAGAVVILRGAFGSQELLDGATTLVEEGLNVIEVTLNSPAALENIGLLRSAFGDAALIGAGTCRDAAQVSAALEAGAQFTVAPNLDRRSVELALERDRLHLPGVFTGSEVADALRFGASMLKLFPCDAHGPVLLRALSAPFDDVEFVAVGGVDAGNLSGYFAAGAVAVGLGSAVTKHFADPAALRRAAGAMSSVLASARGQEPRSRA